MNLNKFVTDEIKSALGGIPAFAGVDLSNIVVEVPRAREHGDFSTNAALVLKTLGAPRDVAAAILPNIAALGFVADASVAGPGFINIKLKDEFILEQSFPSVTASGAETLDSGFAVQPRPGMTPLVIDLDYGSYNVAKSLHIGHLRTSIVGDTFNRIAKYLGHKTVSYNHIGDWGRPMGLVIAYIESLHPDWPFFAENFDAGADLSEYKISAAELDQYYPAASARAKEDTEFLARAQSITKEFQDGHPGHNALYKLFLKVSLDMMDDIIKKLNMMSFDNTLGEANASEYVGAVEKLLREKKLLVSDDGAEIVNVKRDTDTAPMPPLMFLNSRGADTYGATDLGALYYRKKTDNPDRVIYFTDLRQNLHFQQVFRVAEMTGLFAAEQLEHIGYGTINGPDGKPFKTRDGNVAGLLDIIEMVDEAARHRVGDSGKILPDETVEMIALAALKFNDLLHDIKSNYVFDPDAVTQFEGRTGPYILYTAVRLNSIINRVGARENAPDEKARFHAPLGIDERNLLLAILDFERAINAAFDKRATDVLANYTYDLCQLVNTFYHNCPILRDDVPADVQAHRLGIVRAAVRTLSLATDLMGLKIPAEM